MNNELIQRFSINSPAAGKWISFYTLAIIILFAMGCSKEELANGGLPSGNGSNNQNGNIYFKLYFKEVVYPFKANTYSNFVGSLEAITTKDSSGDSATEIRIIVPQFVRGITGSSARAGDLDVNFRLIKKGTNLIGTYKNELRDSTINDYYQHPRISIMSTIPGVRDNGNYLIDSTGLEFNISKAGISDTDGPFVEGDFSFRLYSQLYISTKIPVTGTFRLYRY